MPDVTKIKTTMMIDAELYEEFVSVVREIGLRRDVLLSKWLAMELHHLQSINPNSGVTAKFQKAVRAASKDTQKKVVFSLERSMVKKLNAICREKGISRDAFVESYITYLLKDVDNGLGPLHQIANLIQDPRIYFDHDSEGDRTNPYDELSRDIRVEDLHASRTK